MINKYVRVEQGSYRGKDMSGRVFPIIKDYQKFAGDKEGGFVTIDCSELDGFEGLDKARVNVPGITDLTITTEGEYIINRDQLNKATAEMPKLKEGEETDEQAIERIAARFSILDCDAILYDDLALNLLKAALDTGKKRTLHWNTESRTLMAEGMPNSFEFHGGVIFITNIKFDNVKSKKLQDHLQALQSRCHYLDLTIDSMRDRMLRIRQICRAGMLDKYAMGTEAEEELIQFIFRNKHKLREISLRMVLKIADLWKMAPDRYQHLAEQTCMRPGA
jgi:hypothetical protein